MLTQKEIDVLEERQVSWALKYKEVMNEPKVRERVVYTQTKPIAFYTYPYDKVGSNHHPDRGTVYVEDEHDVEAAHFMAYHLDRDGTARLYDPARIGRWSRQQMSKFSSWMGIPVMLEPMYHQIDGFDTWCQSWSAAYLDNTMRFWLPESISKSESRVLSLRIVRTFVERIALECPEHRHLRTLFYRNRYHVPEVFRYFFDDRKLGVAAE